MEGMQQMNLFQTVGNDGFHLALGHIGHAAFQGKHGVFGYSQVRKQSATLEQHAGTHTGFGIQPILGPEGLTEIGNGSALGLVQLKDVITR